MAYPGGPGLALPPWESSPEAPPPPPGSSSGSIMLSDVMGRDRSINIFAGFIRDTESVSKRLDDPSVNSTVLAPLNSVIEKLPRKPWEDPKDYSALGEDAYEGEDGQERAQRNMRRFVETHIVPLSPWPAGEKAKTLGGDQDVWWEEKGGTRMIQPGHIEVVSVASTVANGQVWILKGVRDLA